MVAFFGSIGRGFEPVGGKLRGHGRQQLLGRVEVPADRVRGALEHVGDGRYGVPLAEQLGDGHHLEG